jgi:type II secretory pathway pseudopilin PulG
VPAQTISAPSHTLQAAPPPGVTISVTPMCDPAMQFQQQQQQQLAQQHALQMQIQLLQQQKQALEDNLAAMHYSHLQQQQQQQQQLMHPFSLSPSAPYMSPPLTASPAGVPSVLPMATPIPSPGLISTEYSSGFSGMPPPLPPGAALFPQQQPLHLRGGAHSPPSALPSGHPVDAHLHSYYSAHPPPPPPSAYAFAPLPHGASIYVPPPSPGSMGVDPQQHMQLQQQIQHQQHLQYLYAQQLQQQQHGAFAQQQQQQMHLLHPQQPLQQPQAQQQAAVPAPLYGPGSLVHPTAFHPASLGGGIPMALPSSDLLPSAGVRISLPASSIKREQE